MTLENLLHIGKLKAYAADGREIDRLLEAADTALRDAAVQGLSAGGQLDPAWRGIMQAALAAIHMNGYRPATSEPGHHQVVIQALPRTIGLAPDRLPLLESFRKARNRSDYDGIPVSDAMALECRAEATRILAEVRAWRQRQG